MLAFGGCHQINTIEKCYIFFLVPFYIVLNQLWDWDLLDFSSTLCMHISCWWYECCIIRSICVGTKQKLASYKKSLPKLLDLSEVGSWQKCVIRCFFYQNKLVPSIKLCNKPICICLFYVVQSHYTYLFTCFAAFAHAVTYMTRLTQPYQNQLNNTLLGKGVGVTFITLIFSI